ncbi:hypothetical protein BTS2_0498 [Bacillus sp. TS-2]|nr:hypothetical protein BTS2_0498 [Bacillus sp. TS-2]
MSKQTLNVLFKKMQRDDKKDVLKFEFKGKEDDPKDENGNPKKITLPQAVYSLVGEMVNIEVEGCDCGPITAELAKANKDSKKVVLDLNLKGDSSEKAIALYRKAGQNVTLHIEPSQSSLLEGEEKQDDHEGIKYEVDLAGGSAKVNKPTEEQEEIEDPEPVNDDDLPF